MRDDRAFGLRRIPMAAWVALAAVSATASAQPVAISQDPPIDRAHPASGSGLQFISKGERVNAMLYLPAGAGPHPAVLLLHGLPGNEQNLDLARAMQRAGWAVVTFHYRGSWGSGGKFTLAGGCDDLDSLIAEISSADGPAKWHIDPHRMVIMGHSYGGFVSSCAAQRHPELAAVGLLAPWDPSMDSRQFAKLSAEQARKRAVDAFNDVDGRLAGADAQSLMDDVRLHGGTMSLSAAAQALSVRPLLLATATRDDPDDQGGDLRAALAKMPGGRVTFRLFDTDHGFNDQRIALETFVLDWLGSLPISPAR